MSKKKIHFNALVLVGLPGILIRAARELEADLATAQDPTSPGGEKLTADEAISFASALLDKAAKPISELIASGLS